jgi:hypothetical protein
VPLQINAGGIVTSADVVIAVQRVAISALLERACVKAACTAS